MDFTSIKWVSTGHDGTFPMMPTLRRLRPKDALIHIEIFRPFWAAWKDFVSMKQIIKPTQCHSTHFKELEQATMLCKV